MIKKLLFLSLLMTSVMAVAQEVCLDDCQKWARENYPEVKRFDIIRATEACNLSNAAKKWLPMISLGLEGGWTNVAADINDLLSEADETADLYSQTFQQVLTSLNAKPSPRWGYRGVVEIAQPIYDGGATALQRTVARKQAEAERAKIEVSLHSLEEKVLDVYFAILLLEDRKHQAALNSELLDKNLEKLRNLEKEGLVMEIDVEAVEVEQLKLRQGCDMIDENLEIYRATLSLLTGHNLATQSLVRPTLPDTERPAFSLQSEMQLLDKEGELLSLKNQYEKVMMRPKIGLLGQAFYGFPGNNIFRNVVNHNPQLNMSFGLKVTWDITPFYKHKNNLNLLRMEQQTLENHRELLLFRQRLTNTSLETRAKRLESIRKQDDRIVELRQKLRLAEETKLDNSMVDATELLKKINDEAEAKLLRSIHETEILHDIYKLLIFGDTEK